MASVNHDCEIPPELKCTLCKSLFVDAVIIGCCKHSFCEKCKFLEPIVRFSNNLHLEIFCELGFCEKCKFMEPIA